MKYIILSVIVAVVLLSGCNNTEAEYPESLENLHQNVLSDILINEPDDEIVRSYLDEQKEDGSWPDIDYTSQERGSWPPAVHLSRTLGIAKAYKLRGSKFYNKKKVSHQIHLALNFWFDNDLICPNWWYPEIGVPRILNPIMVLMEPELTSEQKERGVKILSRSELGMTGQNKVWLAGNVLLKSMLLRNEDTIRLAADAIKEELIVSLGEGVQPDWSYHQHGPQLQFGNYGLSYVSDMIKWINILQSTPFQFDNDKMEILRNYILEGQQWVTWKGRYDISACGRQLFPESQRTKAAAIAESIKKMEQLDPEYAERYRNANNWESLSGNKHFWRSDFQIQRNPDYYFSVKMCSDRVIGAESCNSENLQGYYMGDGAMFLYQTQQEYEDIFPFWDWKKIPGTTVHQNEEQLPVLTARGYRIESDFVGGVSDGKQGIAVMDYNRNGLKARKSWFMVDNMIICLGSGINSSAGYPVTTGINQAFYNGEIESNLDKQVPEDLDYKWLLHNNVGYYFPQKNQVKCTADFEKGSWNQVAARYPDRLLHARIFKLWLDHGNNPQDEEYQFVLVPNASSQQMKKLDSEFSYELINNKNRQEIIAKNGSRAGIAFYEPGKSSSFNGIEVDKACVLLVESYGNGIKLSVADPTQKSEELELRIKGRLKGDGTSVTNNVTTIKCKLPEGGNAGSTKTIMLHKI